MCCTPYSTNVWCPLHVVGVEDLDFIKPVNQHAVVALIIPRPLEVGGRQPFQMQLKAPELLVSPRTRAIRSFPNAVHHAPRIAAPRGGTRPSNNTMASAGAGAGDRAGPGLTRRGTGRSGSCTTHSHHGSLGVALCPNTPEPSRAWTIGGSAAGRFVFPPENAKPASSSDKCLRNMPGKVEQTGWEGDLQSRRFRGGRAAAGLRHSRVPANPKGIASSSPRLPSPRGYLGQRFWSGFNRNAVAANTATTTIQSQTYFSSHSISCFRNNARSSS